MNEIEWKFKEDTYKRAASDSYDFWYDLTDGGYIEPKECLDINQAKILNNAVAIIESFQEAFEEFCLGDEEE